MKILSKKNQSYKSLKESQNTYKMRLTHFVTIEFIPLYDENKVEIDFINKEDNKYIGVFDINVEDVNWFDDQEVCDFLSKEIVVAVLSNYLFDKKDEWSLIGDVCHDMKELSEAFENLLKSPSLEFSQCVIDLFDLKNEYLYKKPIRENKEIKTDFDITNENFYLNYCTNKLKGAICVDLDKDVVDVKYHWENGDYYGPENDSGSLPGGYYGRGYEIDDIDVPVKYMNELFFDEDDNEISKEEFLQLNSLSEESLENYLTDAKEALSSEIEDYVNDNEEDFIHD